MNELGLNSDGIEVKLVCTRKRCRTQERRECIFESIISTASDFDVESDGM